MLSLDIANGNCRSKTIYSPLFAASPNRRFEFQKRSQLFIRVHNETLPVVAMRVNNPDRSPLGINR
jgi:hypothetical protein